MKSFKGRPVITAEDYPETVVKALRESIPLVNAGEIPSPDPWSWRHNAQNSYETIEDSFRLNGDEYAHLDAEAIVYMTPDDLEKAIVWYGLSPERTEAEAEHVDSLLLSLDGLKAQAKS